MGKFERNDVSLIQKEIRKNVQHPKIGKVQEIYEHGAPDDDSNFEADVIVDGDKQDKCPILNPGNDTIDLPESGDKVLLIYTEEQNKKPYVVDTVWTVKDRPPIGKAGMMRRRFRIGNSKSPSPAGSGDIFFTGYTEYDKEAANTGKDERVPEKSVLQIAKHPKGDNFVPTEQESLPAKVEFYDAPVDDEAHITVTINYDDGSSSDATWGMKFDIKNGTWQIVDPEGFGIEASGDGNFTWHHKDITMNEVSGPTGPLNL